jgi:hypothetical protein
MTPLRMHLATGDTIVQSGLIVELHKKFGALAVPTYPKNAVFVQSLFRDYPEISTYSIPESWPWGAPLGLIYDEAMRKAGLDKGKEIRLGSYGGEGVGTKSTYLQAGVPYEKRWDSCPIEEAAKKVEQIEWPNNNRIFLHDDPARNFVITKWIDRSTAFFPSWASNILSYVNILKTAEEIHVIDSAFFCLVEQLEVEARLFFHRYARVDPTVIPSRNDWMVIND